MTENNFIMVIDDVLPKTLCSDIITTFETSPNKMAGRTSGGVDLDKKRSTDSLFSQMPEFSAYLNQVLPHVGQGLRGYLQKYLFALIGAISLSVKHPKTGKVVTLTHDNFDEVGVPNLPLLTQHLFRTGAINIQKYEKNSGGYPYWHSETYPQLQHNEALHRVLLWMFYLNDVAEGGETDFYYQQQSVKPKAGRMVIAPAYFTHTHRGNAPISNNKYILTSWMLFNKAENIYHK